MKKPWFGVNRFWGWYPKSWQGYSVIVVMFSALIYIMFSAVANSHSVSDTLLSAFPFVCLTISTTMLVALLTGVKPEFGKKNKGSKNYSPDNPSAYFLLAFVSIPIALYYLLFQAYLGTIIFLLTGFLLYQIYLKLKFFQKT